MDKFYHSVRLQQDLCKGCINCIKRCPTSAIRVRNGKARITSKFCIDCGECIRICPHHAKVATYDHLDALKQYKFTVILPAPSLYAQFNNLDDTNIVLTALLMLGFDDVYEVSGAAELVSEESRTYIREHMDNWPYISTACPSVVRLIRVRFPNLLSHLLPVKPPVEVAAQLARKKAVKLTGYKPEEIGVFFLSPCPSKVTYSKTPLGVEKSEIDHVLAIKEIYPLMLPLMKEAQRSPKQLSISGKIGIGWGGSGGEASGLISDNYLAADGIENVIQVLEDLEDEKLPNLQFIELDACAGGCVGGVLTVENPYVAAVKLKKLRKYMPVSCNHLGDEPAENLYLTQDINYEPVFRLGNDLKSSILKMNQVERLCQKFPGLDCGSCGAPTCKALAEDIVRGEAKENDCIYLFRQDIHELSDEIAAITNSLLNGDGDGKAGIHMLQDYIHDFSSRMARLDPLTQKENDDDSTRSD